MSRLKGFRKVDVIKHEKLGVEVPLKLDFSTMEFHATYGDRQFVDKDGDRVRDDVLAHIEHESAIEWVPVIRVLDVSHRLSWDATDAVWWGTVRSLALVTARLYLGLSKSGRILKVKWETPEAQRYEKAQDAQLLAEHQDSDDEGARWLHHRPAPSASDFHLPWREMRDGYDRNERGAVFLAYTEELWTGLQQLQNAIERERGQLATLVGDVASFDLVAQLGAGAMQKLLPAAPRASDDDDDE